MAKHILIIGPSGSRKTYISASLRKHGINALDADLIEGLSGWFGAGGKQVTCPESADKKFLDNHEFLWNRNFLSQFLQEQQNDFYLFGMSGNVFDMADLFDEVYFLKTSPEILAERLRHESRENPMSKTDFQLENALNWAKEIEETANKLGIQMIDANQSPKQIFSQINNKSTSKKVIFFDLYQTLIDIDIDEEKKRNQANAWKHLAKSLGEFGIKINSAELIELNKKQQEDFYTGKDKKIQHHSFCKILGKILKDNFGVELTEEKVCSLIYDYHKIARGYVRLYPDVAETLARLKEKYILSVASYTQECFTKPELIELGIDKFFSYFVYTSNIGFHKASPKFYEQCLEITREKAENCVMVGDNYDVDILIPQKLGIKTVWINNPLTAHQYIHQFGQGPKDMINLAEFAKLPEVIDRIFN